MPTPFAGRPDWEIQIINKAYQDNVPLLGAPDSVMSRLQLVARTTQGAKDYHPSFTPAEAKFWQDQGRVYQPSTAAPSGAPKALPTGGSPTPSATAPPSTATNPRLATSGGAPPPPDGKDAKASALQSQAFPGQSDPTDPNAPPRAPLTPEGVRKLTEGPASRFIHQTLGMGTTGTPIQPDASTQGFAGAMGQGAMNAVDSAWDALGSAGDQLARAPLSAPSHLIGAVPGMVADQVGHIYDKYIGAGGGIRGAVQRASDDPFGTVMDLMTVLGAAHGARAGIDALKNLKTAMGPEAPGTATPSAGEAAAGTTGAEGAAPGPTTAAEGGTPGATTGASSSADAAAGAAANSALTADHVQQAHAMIDQFPLPEAFKQQLHALADEQGTRLQLPGAGETPNLTPNLGAATLPAPSADAASLESATTPPMSPTEPPVPGAGPVAAGAPAEAPAGGSEGTAAVSTPPPAEGQTLTGVPSALPMEPWQAEMMQHLTGQDAPPASAPGGPATGALPPIGATGSEGVHLGASSAGGSIWAGGTGTGGPLPAQVLQQLDLDPAGHARLTDAIATLSGQPQTTPVDSLRDKTGLFMQELRVRPGDDLSIDKAGIQQMSGPEVLARRNLLRENVDMIDRMSKAAADSTADAATREQAVQAVQRLSQQNDRLLNGVVKATGPAGQDMASIKLLASSASEPESFLLKAQELLGDAPLTDDMKTDIYKLVNALKKACD